MTEGEIVAMGDYCEFLLKQDNFATLCSEFEHQSITHILSTKPDEAKKREDVYAAVAGFRDFLGLATEFVQERDKIRQRDSAPQDEFADFEVGIDNSTL